MVNLQRQRKKTEEKHELKEETGSSENKRINARRHRRYFSMEEKVRERSSCSPELVEFFSFVGEFVSAVKSTRELASAVRRTRQDRRI
uniref:Uncharacterized protein n=1 Tax=Brassica campestris TaxID=3711 RepID=M4EXI8_BRACM